MSRTNIVLYKLTKQEMKSNNIDNTMLVNTIKSIDAKTAKKAIKAIEGKLHFSSEDKQRVGNFTTNKDTELIKAVDKLSNTRSYTLNMIIVHFIIDHINELRK